jgi:hypothetical protein
MSRVGNIIFKIKGLRVGDLLFPETFEKKFRDLVKFIARGKIKI